MELAFGARLPGLTHLQLHEFNPTSTQTTEQPTEAPQQWLDAIPLCSPGLAAPHWANLRMTASPTQIHANPSSKEPTPSDCVSYNLDAHPDLPLLNGPSPGVGPLTRIQIPQHGLRQGPAHSDPSHLLEGLSLWAPDSPTRNLQTETTTCRPQIDSPVPN